VSERHACTVVGIHRSTMRLKPPPITTEEAELRAWLRRFSTDRPRWGWRRAAKVARRAGWKVNNKRIRRLWREEGLRVPQRRKKKRLTGIGVAVRAMSPIRPNVIWAMDFQFDTTADGRTVKMLNVIDEFTREALAIESRSLHRRRRRRRCLGSPGPQARGAALRALRQRSRIRGARRE
jgi:putative transposase